MSVEVNVAGDVIATAGRAVCDLVARDVAPSQGWIYVGMSCARRAGLLPRPVTGTRRRPQGRSITHWRSEPGFERG